MGTDDVEMAAGGVLTGETLDTWECEVTVNGGLLGTEDDEIADEGLTSTVLEGTTGATQDGELLGIEDGTEADEGLTATLLEGATGGAALHAQNAVSGVGPSWQHSGPPPQMEESIH